MLYMMLCNSFTPQIKGNHGQYISPPSCLTVVVRALGVNISDHSSLHDMRIATYHLATFYTDDFLYTKAQSFDNYLDRVR